MEHLHRVLIWLANTSNRVVVSELLVSGHSCAIGISNPELNILEQMWLAVLLNFDLDDVLYEEFAYFTNW